MENGEIRKAMDALPKNTMSCCPRREGYDFSIEYFPMTDDNFRKLWPNDERGPTNPSNLAAAYFFMKKEGIMSFSEAMQRAHEYEKEMMKDYENSLAEHGPCFISTEVGMYKDLMRFVSGAIKGADREPCDISLCSDKKCPYKKENKPFEKAEEIHETANPWKAVSGNGKRLWIP